jgi:hypothetical protein
MTPEEIAAWVTETRARQRRGPRISDATAAATLAMLVADTLTDEPQADHDEPQADRDDGAGSGPPRRRRNRQQQPNARETRSGDARTS